MDLGVDQKAAAVAALETEMKAALETEMKVDLETEMKADLETDRKADLVTDWIVPEVDAGALVVVDVAEEVDEAVDQVEWTDKADGSTKDTVAVIRRKYPPQTLKMSVSGL